MEAKLIGDSDVMLKSTVNQEEHKFFVQHQKQLNKQIFAALAKQKDQIRKIKILIGHTDLEGGVDIEAFAIQQGEENNYIKANMKKLEVAVLMMKRKYDAMQDHVVELRNKLASG